LQKKDRRDLKPLSRKFRELKDLKDKDNHVLCKRKNIKYDHHIDSYVFLLPDVKLGRSSDIKFHKMLDHIMELISKLRGRKNSRYKLIIMKYDNNFNELHNNIMKLHKENDPFTNFRYFILGHGNKKSNCVGSPNIQVNKNDITECIHEATSQFKQNSRVTVTGSFGHVNLKNDYLNMPVDAVTDDTCPEAKCYLNEVNLSLNYYLAEDYVLTKSETVTAQ
jgi:hypothetical protein